MPRAVFAPAHRIDVSRITAPPRAIAWNLRSTTGNEAMHRIPKFKLWSAGALVWVAGAAFTRSALAAR